MKNLISWWFLCLLSISHSITCSASELLASQTFGGSSYGGALTNQTIGIQFFFGYGITNGFPAYPVSYAGGTYLQIDENELGNLIWGNLYFNNGDQGSFDVYPSDSPGFAAISSYLADNVDQVLTYGYFANNSDRIITGGGATSLQDYTHYDLSGVQIDFYRLVINDLAWSGSNITVNAQWQIWGSPAPVPEPANFAFMLSGLLLIGFAAKLRQ